MSTFWDQDVCDTASFEPCLKIRTGIVLCHFPVFSVGRGYYRFEKLDEIGQAFDDAWKAVASEDSEAGRLAAAAESRPEETARRPLQVRP